MQQQLPRHIPFVVPVVLHRTEKSVKVKGWRRVGGALEVVDIWLPKGGIDGEKEVPGGIEFTLWVKVAASKGLVPSEEYGYTEATIYHLGPIPASRPIHEIEAAIAQREAERQLLAQKFHQAIADGVLEIVDLRSRAVRVTRAEDGGRKMHLGGASAEVLIGVVVESLLPLRPLKQELRRARRDATVQQQLDIKGLPLFEAALSRDKDPEFSAAGAALATGA